MVSEGYITFDDIEDSKYSKSGSRVVSTGLPAYCILQLLIRSVKANSQGLLLSKQTDNLIVSFRVFSRANANVFGYVDDNVTEITSANRPRDTLFDWFVNPLLIMKDQIKARHHSPSEEDYLCKLVLFNSNPERLKNSFVGMPPECEVKRAELEALARR